MLLRAYWSSFAGGGCRESADMPPTWLVVRGSRSPGRSFGCPQRLPLWRLAKPRRGSPVESCSCRRGGMVRSVKDAATTCSAPPSVSGRGHRSQSRSRHGPIQLGVARPSRGVVRRRTDVELAVHDPATVGGDRRSPKCGSPWLRMHFATSPSAHEPSRAGRSSALVARAVPAALCHRCTERGGADRHAVDRHRSAVRLLGEGLDPVAAVTGRVGEARNAVGAHAPGEPERLAVDLALVGLARVGVGAARGTRDSLVSSSRRRRAL